jgi:hypothetical protein
MAFPARYVMSPEVIGTDDADRIKEACKYDAVDFDMTAKTLDLKVGAIVWATGWEPYDANKIDNLGFGQSDNIITNMMMERLAAPNGPTKGQILRPSDEKAPESVAFVQCAGSRDENHLPYCSYICCMASLKQATYVRKQYPDAKIYIFYIDIRAPDIATRNSTRPSGTMRTSSSSRVKWPRSAKTRQQGGDGDCRKCGDRRENQQTVDHGGPCHWYAADGRAIDKTSGRSEVHRRRLHHQ